MEIIFRATDGKIFDNIDECFAYEKKSTNTVPRILKTLDNEGAPCETMDAMYCACNFDASTIDTVLPHSAGHWVWFCDEWIPISEVESNFAILRQTPCDPYADETAPLQLG